MKRVLVVLAFLVGSVVALALSALLHLDTRVGRRAVGDALEHAIGTQIQGSLEIGAVEEVGRDRIVAREVLFRDPSGDPALRLDHVVIDPAPSRFFSEDTIAIASAQVRGARLWMIEGENGLRLEEALDSPPDPSATRGPPSLFLAFEDIHFDDLDSDWRLDGAPSFEIDGASGFLAVRTDDNGEVVVRFDRIAGRAEFDLAIPISAGIRRGSGRIHAGYRRMGAFDIELDVAGSPLELALDLIETGDGLQARVESGTDGVNIGWLAALGLDLVMPESELAPDLATDRPERRRGDPSK